MTEYFAAVAKTWSDIDDNDSDDNSDFNSDYLIRYINDMKKNHNEVILTVFENWKLQKING